MYFDKQTLQTNKNQLAQFTELMANRDAFNVMEKELAAKFKCNAADLSKDFWADVDRSIVARRAVIGMEILEDLRSIQTILPVGKTAKLYNKIGEIAKDVSVSLDGQAPYSFDHAEYAQDGDPIPVFTAGYGVNWRHAEGLSTVGFDLIQDSQDAKMQEFNKKLVSYALIGDSKIVVDGKAGQGLKNHRNTKKVDLGASGANINLTTAPIADIATFFATGAFGTTAIANRVAAYDVLWVSPQIYANLMKPAVVGGVQVGTGLDYIRVYTANVKEIRQTFALVGNEFLGYVRDRSVVTPLVGASVGVTALPRFLPQHNFNFQIMAAMGIQVKSDADGLGGVIYGAAV